MNMKNALILAAIVEAGTGLAMLIVPAFVWQLIFGEQLTGVGIPVARVGAMALIGLGIVAGRVRRSSACSPTAHWPRCIWLTSVSQGISTASFCGRWSSFT